MVLKPVPATPHWLPPSVPVDTIARLSSDLIVAPTLSKNDRSDAVAPVGHVLCP